MEEDALSSPNGPDPAALAEPGFQLAGGEMNETATPYRVLARKYRPSTFKELIGQEALVRTLTNAIEMDRLAHAYILTGVRGVGKTTTARILARCLNYEDKDGTPGPKVDIETEGVHCAAISESRHVDVIEMDAASRTGIDDIREIIDGARYKPASARYKIYIIDEVHMLSRAAFNGLLKTLEEPPDHVIFIFATTEIRKVPVTVLSRCQRFDLRRVGVDELCAHLGRIAKLEGAELSPGALTLIARAAEGSVRDGLSLLDQAIAQGTGEIGETDMRDMLGLADRNRIFDLFEAVMRGDLPGALAEIRAQYDTGADPVVVLNDLLEVVHWLTRIKLVPTAAEDTNLPESERQRGSEMAAGLSVPILTRAWQLLLKGLGEVRGAPNTLSAAEMVLVRLGCAADLPSPADLIRRLQGEEPGKSAVSAPRSSEHSTAPKAERLERPGSPEPAAKNADPALPSSFADVVALAAARRDIRLKIALEQQVHLVHFEPGRIEFRPTANAAPQLAAQISEALAEWTGQRWIVSVANADGAPTFEQQQVQEAARREQYAMQDPLVQKAMEMFPGAKISAVREQSEMMTATDGGETAAKTPATVGVSTTRAGTSIGEV